MPELDRYAFVPIGGLPKKPGHYYAAYGSNLSLERMKGRCPNAEPIGTAAIPGYRLLFKKSQSGFYATIEQDANREVPVLIYRVSEFEESLLDRHEGYPKYYYKRFFRLQIRRLNGKKMREPRLCMAYVLHEERPLGEPYLDYYRLLDAGYRNWGFDVEMLEKALSDSIGFKTADKYLRVFRSV